MGCLLLLLALISPRLALVAVFLMSDLLTRAFDNALVPLIGFFVLPWTTLIYAGAWATGTHEVTGAEWLFVLVAFLADLGAYGRSTRRYD